MDRSVEIERCPKRVILYAYQRKKRDGNTVKRLKRAIIICLIGLSSTLSFAWASDPIVQLNGDRFTLGVTNQSLSTILEKLSDQGIHIRIDPRINPKITAAFTNRPIGDAMNTILRSVNYALIWKQDNVSGSDEPRLWEIRIFYKGQERRIRPLKKSVTQTVVKKSDGTFYRKDVLLLQLAPTMTEAALADVVNQLSATIVDAHTPLGIVQLRLPPGTDVQTIAKTVAGYPGIQAAEPDYAYPLEGGFPIPMDREPLAPPSVLVPPTEGTVVAVMDSGLLTDYEDSPFLQGTYDAVSPDSTMNDFLGHGTQMTLVAAGVVNPLGGEEDNGAGSPVLAIRAFDDNGFTSNFTLIRGIDYAIQQEARVLSLSWGSETTNPLLESATHYATANGLILVAAAGNIPTGKPVYPAAYESVIAVGALTPDGERWEQSNYGDFVDIQAPSFAYMPVGYQGDSGLYAGTSIATAYIAHRVAAILDQTPDADRSAVLQKLSTEQ